MILVSFQFIMFMCFLVSVCADNLLCF